MQLSKMIFRTSLGLLTSSLFATAQGPIVRHMELNPGLDAQVNILPMVKNNNEVTYTIVELPSNATLYYDDVKIDAPGFMVTDPNKVTVDPDDGDLTVVFAYTATHSDGKVSEPRNIIMRFLDLGISGAVYHDADGNAKVDGKKISNLEGEPLFVSLVNKEEKVLASNVISSEGTFHFSNKDGIQPNTNYALVLSTKPHALTSYLPEKWASSGESIETLKKGKDAKKDAVVVVPLREKSIGGVAFGLDMKPTAVDKIEPVQLNPGAKHQVPVPKLEGSDTENAEKVRYFITSLPDNATLYDNTQKVRKAGLEVKDVSKLTLDPDDGDQKVDFSYVTADYAGVTSEPAKVEMTFSGLQISGQVFNDGDGGEKVDGMPIASLDERALNVTLLNHENIILASTPIDVNGSYRFDGTQGVMPKSNYRIVVSTQPRAKTSRLAKGWNHSAEGLMNTAKGSDSVKDGSISVKVAKDNINNVNFGLNKKPVAKAFSVASQLNPGDNGKVAVPALQGSDNENSEDLIYSIVSLPKNATLYMGNTAIEKENFIVTKPEGLTLDPKNAEQEVTFTYKVTDQDGIDSDPVDVQLSFTELTLSGHLLNDGKNDDNVSGALLNDVDGKPLYVLLLDSNKTLLSSKAIEKGTFLFDGKDGVKPESQFFLALATAPEVAAFGLPKSWNHTGEALNSLNEGKDSSADGVIAVKVEQQNIQEIDFGINKQPHADNKESKAQLNPGLDIRVAVPALSGDDRESGKKLIYKIESLPTLGTLYYNNTKVDEIGFIVENDSNLSIDPEDSDVIVLFTYAATDEAGVISDPARVTMPFKGLHISGRIVEDGNGNDEIKGKDITIPEHLHPYATLLDEEHSILASKPLTRDAKFSFSGVDGIRPNAHFTVVVSLEKNSLVPVLPSAWSASGAVSGEKHTSDENASDGTLTVYVGEENIDTLKFGLNKKPNADNKTVKTMINPGQNVEVDVPLLTGHDRESGTNLRYVIRKVPENATLHSKGMVVKNNDQVDPKYLSIDPDDGEQTVLFTYESMDEEGVLSEPATVTMHFTGLNISGSVLEDFMIDGQVDSVTTVAADQIKLFVTLLSDKGEVLASVPVSKKVRIFLTRLRESMHIRSTVWYFL